jgi:hypothetical protein
LGDFLSRVVAKAAGTSRLPSAQPRHRPYFPVAESGPGEATLERQESASVMRRAAPAPIHTPLPQAPVSVRPRMDVSARSRPATEQITESIRAVAVTPDVETRPTPPASLHSYLERPVHSAHTEIGTPNVTVETEPIAPVRSSEAPDQIPQPEVDHAPSQSVVAKPHQEERAMALPSGEFVPNDELNPVELAVRVIERTPIREFRPSPVPPRELRGEEDSIPDSQQPRLDAARSEPAREYLRAESLPRSVAEPRNMLEEGIAATIQAPWRQTQQTASKDSTVEVRIGRVEVRVNSPAPPAPAELKPRRGPRGFEEYASVRRYFTRTRV